MMPEVLTPSEDSRLADLAFLMRFITLDVLAQPAVRDAVNRLVEVLDSDERGTPSQTN